jgi:hypothetical protein
MFTHFVIISYLVKRVKASRKNIFIPGVRSQESEVRMKEASENELQQGSVKKYPY